MKKPCTRGWWLRRTPEDLSSTTDLGLRTSVPPSFSSLAEHSLTFRVGTLCISSTRLKAWCAAEGPSHLTWSSFHRRVRKVTSESIMRDFGLVLLPQASAYCI